MSNVKIGIVARTKEEAARYAAKRFWPSEFWVHVPSGDKLVGREAAQIIIDDLADTQDNPTENKP